MTHTEWIAVQIESALCMAEAELVEGIREHRGSEELAELLDAYYVARTACEWWEVEHG